jgi:hypothetical protein
MRGISFLCYTTGTLMIIACMFIITGIIMETIHDRRKK